MRRLHLIAIPLACVFLASAWLVGLTSSAGVYNPWYDLDDNGKIDIYDVVRMAGSYGTTGTPYEAKAALEYDSGWTNITDKAGQYFDITHNLNSTDLIVDITGKTSITGGIHQRFLGGTDFVAGWNQTYGGPSTDIAYCMVQTDDGGYALAGETNSYGAGGIDFWLVKTDSDGNSLWSKTFGGVGHEIAYSIVQTADDGYTIVGATSSFGAGDYDIWLVKTDAAGNMQWNRTYGGVGMDGTHSMVQTADGGYAIGGVTASFGAGGIDFWLVKTDAAGNMQWNRTYGGVSEDFSESLVQTSDGGYALAGPTQSYGAGNRDFWLVKTDSAGNIQWNKTYGGINEDWSTSVIATVDGGYALTGFTWSFGDSRQAWLVKTDAAGNMQWNKAIGGPNEDFAFKLVQTNDGGYILAAGTRSFGAGDWDLWLVKTDPTGNVQWNKTYGGPSPDCGYYVVKTADKGYAVAGYTGSFGTGGSDMWLIKTDATGNALHGFNYGLAWVDSTANSITLYRGTHDTHWNFVRIRTWKLNDTP